MTSCEPENQLGEESTHVLLSCLLSHHCLIFFNTKVSNTGEGVPRSVYTDIYSDTAHQTIALSELQVEE